MRSWGGRKRTPGSYRCSPLPAPRASGPAPVSGSGLSLASPRCPRTRPVLPPPFQPASTRCPSPGVPGLTFTWDGRSPAWRMPVGSSPAAEPLSAPSPLAMTRGPPRLGPPQERDVPLFRGPPLGPGSRRSLHRRHGRSVLAVPAGGRTGCTLPCTPPRAS